jgi:hypothetical protein
LFFIFITYFLKPIEFRRLWIMNIILF